MTLETLDSLEREQRLDEAVVAYLETVEAGKTPDLEEWLGRYPELAGELREFFADQVKVQRWTEPLRPVAEAARAAVVFPQAGEGMGAGDGMAALRAVLPTFADYELLETIGAGSMGVVYKARQKSLNRIVALKIIRADDAGSAREVQRFRNEAETVAALDHANIVPVHEVSEHQGQLYFTMKLIEDGSLEKWIADCRLQIFGKKNRGRLLT